MTDLIYDYITQGVDLILAAAILSSVVILLRSATVLSATSANQTANSQRLGYYREYAKFDCKDDLTCADALSAIVYYRDSVQINFYPTAGNTTYVIQNDPTKDGKFFIKPDASHPAYEIDYQTLKDECGKHVGANYKARLFEDNSTTPSTTGYQGGIITGIEIYAE